MNNKNRQEMQNRFSLRKLTIGLASVSLGMFFMQTSNQVKAATLPTAPAANRANATTVQTGQTVQPGQTVQTGQTSNHGSQNLVTRATTLALFKQNTPAPTTPNATDTTPIAPSTTVPSYDGTKVVDTPFYNNPKLRDTNSELIKDKTGQYTFYFTAKDASGKEYASSYAAEKGNPTGVVLNSILDKDAGAYDPNSLEYHFYYQNTTDQDQTINYTLRMADWLNPYKGGRPGHPGRAESTLVPDGSRISDVKVTSEHGNTYDISSVTKTLDGVKSRDGDLRYVQDVPVNLTVKANDAINLVIPFVLNTTAKESTGWIDDHNEFSVRENGQQTGYLVVRSSTYVPLFSEDKTYPVVNVGNNHYTHDYPDNPGAFTLDPSVLYRNEDFMNGFWDGSNYNEPNIYNYSTPTNKSTVYNSYSHSYLLLDKYEDYLTKHGFTVAFNNGKPKPYYTYQLGKTGAKMVDKNGNPVQGETKAKGLPYFEVVPVILLNQDETYTTKTAPTAWDPSTMVNKVADPTNYRYWDQKTGSAVRSNDKVAQLTAKDFKVTITRDGQAVKPDANGKYDLSKPGTYTVTYSKDFNGTTISNSRKITVTPVKEPDNPSDNNNNNSNNDNNGGNNSGAIVPINPSDNNSNNSNTAPTDNNTDTSKPTDNASKPTDETDKKANNSRSQKESKSKTKATGIKNSSTDNSKPNNGKSIADPMTRQKENGLTGVAQAATTGVKAGQTNSDKLPQTGEKKGMLLSIIGLLAAALGIFGIAINRKKEN